MKKTIVITGSTDGIGKLAAIKIAKEGHQVVLHGRNTEKLKACISEVKEEAKNPSITGIKADLSNFTEVLSMVDKLKKLSRLDSLINNAGIFKSPNDTTESGLDIRFAVNFLAPYILTNGVLSLLLKTSQSRIVNLSSAAQAPVSIEALKGLEKLSVNEAYAQSKLALTMLSFKLAQEVKTITVNAVNPGSLLNTKMANEAYGQHWAPAEKGANIIYDLGLSPAYKTTTGAYFDNDLGELKGGFSEAHADAYDLEKINALMRCTEKLISKELQKN